MTPTRIQNLRKKIQARTAELGIATDHDDTGHYYKFNGVRYPSVTKKLAMLKDEGLMNWKMNRALEYVNEYFRIADIKITDPIPKISLKEILEVTQKAKLAPQQEFEGAGDIGKAVHNWRERWFRPWIRTGELNGSHLDTFNNLTNIPSAKSACKGIINCVNDNRIEPLACELFVADEKLGLGGTLDDLWAVPEAMTADSNTNPYTSEKKRKYQTWLIDLKTSNIGNKNSYYMQVATYWAMFRKLYKIKIDRIFILHVSKTKYGEYKLIELKHPRRYFQMAKSTYKLYDDIKELEELKKPEVKKV